MEFPLRDLWSPSLWSHPAAFHVSVVRYLVRLLNTCEKLTDSARKKLESRQQSAIAGGLDGLDDTPRVSTGRVPDSQ